MLSDWELWAVASFVLKEHGDRAPLFVAGRIGALAAVEDADGIAIWQAVAYRIAELTVPPA